MARTRNLERTRKEILKAAFWEVFTRGFQGVSVDEIVAKTQYTKGAFYHQFPTKLDLGYALVEEVIQPMITERWIEPLDSYENPLDGILAQLRKLIGGCDPAHLRHGCPLNNLVQEMAPVDAGFKKRLQNALDFWIEGVETHLKRAKKKRLLRDDVNTRQVAVFVVMAHEGFYGLLKGLGDPKAFDALFGSLKRYFQTLQSNGY
jgi:AcrR family transcriptional regulator